MSELPSEVKTQWAEFALVESLPNFAKACHVRGHSYIHRCFIVIDQDKPIPYVVFLNEPAGACMVAMDRLLIAPLDKAVVLPQNRLKRWIVKKFCPLPPVL